MRFLVIFLALVFSIHAQEPKLYWWGHDNFGDCLSQKIVEKIVDGRVKRASLNEERPVLFALGSILRKARSGDVVWGSGFRQYRPGDLNEVLTLDVRAVRGPRTRKILMDLGIDCPEIYGDPALLLPYLFPELKREEPRYEYIVIPHLSEKRKFKSYANVVNCDEPVEQVLKKILQSKFVISSSLHGIIVAEAFGIPARLLKPSKEEMLKYWDYYEATGRPNFQYATSVSQAIMMGGEPPIEIDLQPLIDSFPFDYFSEDPRSIAD